MIERGSDLGLLLETATGRRIGQIEGEKLDRDRAIQPGIQSPEHLAHTARTDGRFNLVRTQAGAGSQQHGVGRRLTDGMRSGCRFGRRL